ncbi:PTS sugar transporter subunit IIA [Loigolactobacillus rennini]|uniref:PTS sugar transporter subunit IIA n=1 Tax=Loigolactobacillus rennini TaxID=238013 RepID=UPI00070CF4D2|nr:PTS sugar transporter subunit IIA [Loigolactobacillus rennini]
MIAIIVASHGKFSESILESSRMIFGDQEKVQAVTFMPNESTDDLKKKFENAMATFAPEDQILFLIDLFGGSPFNVASQIVAENLNKYALITGLNLPLLLEAYTVRDKPVAAVVSHLEKTAKAGVKHLELSSLG